jgi:hypothetical protein
VDAEKYTAVAGMAELKACQFAMPSPSPEEEQAYLTRSAIYPGHFLNLSPILRIQHLEMRTVLAKFNRDVPTLLSIQIGIGVIYDLEEGLVKGL